MGQLTFEYPTWYLLLCLILGLVFAVVLYYRERKFDHVGKGWAFLLACLRFTLASLLAMLLLSPLLKSQREEVQQPVIIFVQDASISAKNGMTQADSAAYDAGIRQLRSALSERYEVKSLLFGEAVRSFEDGDTLHFGDRITDISEVLEYMYDTYGNQNVGAIVMATDGVFNEGRHPLYGQRELGAPLHFVALGDTTPQRDLLIPHVYFNKIAYLGDKFPIQVDVQARNLAGRRSQLELFVEKDGRLQKIDSRRIDIQSPDFFRTEDFIAPADQSGVVRYRLALAAAEGEVTRANNVRDFYVEILDAKQKILILANAPHPDLSALKHILRANANYEVDVAFADDFQANVLDFDLVVFHNLPSSTMDISRWLDAMDQRRIPRFFVLGEQTNLNRFNAAQNALEIRGNAQSTNEVQAIFEDTFNLFTTSDELRQRIESLAPISAPFGEYAVGPNAEILARQKIGPVDTDYPLLCFGRDGDHKTGIFAAEGLWKWRLLDYQRQPDGQFVQQLISKAIQYVSVKEDKRRFRVQSNRNLYRENDRIRLDAEVYNNSYERVNEVDVFISIFDANGDEFPFTFTKKDDYYVLDAGLFPEGSYRFHATTTYNGEKMEQRGRFRVESIQLESFDLTARHQLLYAMASKYGGQLYYPLQLEALQNGLLENDDIRPVIYSSSRTRSVIHLKWLFGLLFGLMALEWFLRRYFGSY